MKGKLPFCALFIGIPIGTSTEHHVFGAGSGSGEVGQVACMETLNGVIPAPGGLKPAFFQPLIYIFLPSSQGPRPGPGACEEGWKMFFFQTGCRAVTQESHGVHPLQPISRPCSIEKYPSSRMANRYTRIFDAGGQHTFSTSEQALSKPGG